MTSEKLKEILENHLHWIREDCENWQKKRANLQGADLQGAYLQRADLRGAYLRGANLQGADLQGANLQGADLQGAYLQGAYLQGADLQGADLRGAKKIPHIPMACPDDGAFIGWKKVFGGYIVKLKITEDALRMSSTGRKCRCNKAIVLEIQNQDGTLCTKTEVQSQYDSSFIYKIGDTVSVDNFDCNRWNECAPGIHFFINRQEAVDY